MERPFSDSLYEIVHFPSLIVKLSAFAVMAVIVAITIATNGMIYLFMVVSLWYVVRQYSILCKITKFAVKNISELRKIALKRVLFS